MARFARGSSPGFAVPAPVPDPDVRRLPATLAPALARVGARRDELTKAWIVRLLERASLAEIERLPTDRIAREAPAILAAVVAAASDAGPEAPGAALPPAGVAGAEALAELREAAGGSPAELIADVGALQALVLGELRRELGGDAHLFATAVERVAAAFSALQAEAIQRLVGRRAAELERLANTDELTGLDNVRQLRARLRTLHEQHRRYGHPYAVLLLDVDDLKRVNDSLGHAAGDRALVAVAGALRAVVRAVDTAARVGGDEFCVVAPHQTASRAAILAHRVVHAAATGDPAVGVSIGVVACPQHADDPDALLALADEAMYRAKASGERVAVALAGAAEPAAAEAR